MSQLFVDNIKGRLGGAVNAPAGLNVGGTLTYEDVTNVDSVGIITAQQGIRVGAGQSIGSTTSSETVIYYGDGSNLTGAFDIRDTWLYSG